MTEPIRCKVCHGQPEEVTGICDGCKGKRTQECHRCKKPATYDRLGYHWCDEHWQRECLDRERLCPECGSEHYCPNCDSNEPATGRVVWLNSEHTAHARLCHRCDKEYDRDSVGHTDESQAG